MWLAVLGGSVTTVVGISGFAVEPTKHCLSGSFKSFVDANVFIPLLNDSLIFVAIWFRLMKVGLRGNPKVKDVIKAAFSGESLSVFTKALFRDGQAYYL